MPPILTIQLHVVGVTHHDVGILGPQEWAVERGVLSQTRQAFSPISTHNHQNTDHAHLIVIH